MVGRAPFLCFCDRRCQDKGEGHFVVVDVLRFGSTSRLKQIFPRSSFRVSKSPVVSLCACGRQRAGEGASGVAGLSRALPWLSAPLLSLERRRLSSGGEGGTEATTATLWFAVTPALVFRMRTALHSSRSFRLGAEPARFASGSLTSRPRVVLRAGTTAERDSNLCQENDVHREEP